MMTVGMAIVPNNGDPGREPPANTTTVLVLRRSTAENDWTLAFLRQGMRSHRSQNVVMLNRTYPQNLELTD